MLKNCILTFLVFAVLLTTVLPMQVKSQTKVNQALKNDQIKNDQTIDSSNIKKVFAKSFINDAPIQINVENFEKENIKASKKMNLSKGQKTALYIGIPAAIAATVLIIVFSRKKDRVENGSAYAGCPGNPLCQNR